MSQLHDSVQLAARRSVAVGPATRTSLDLVVGRCRNTPTTASNAVYFNPDDQGMCSPDPEQGLVPDGSRGGRTARCTRGERSRQWVARWHRGGAGHRRIARFAQFGAAMAVTDHSLPALLVQRVEQQPDALAFTFVDGAEDPIGHAEGLTWSQVYQRTLVVADTLRFRGSPGDRAPMFRWPLWSTRSTIVAPDIVTWRW